MDIAPEHLAFSPDSRWYYQGNPEGDSITVIDMQSLKKIKTIPGFAEPLNITFTPDGSKAYVGNYGAHWVGVIDVTAPRADQEDPDRRTSRASRSSIPPSTSARSRASTSPHPPTTALLYAADGDLGVVGVIDTREDKVIKVIRVGPIRGAST